MENRNLEVKRQELASRLVQREVVQCVSMLISGLVTLSQHVSYRVMQDAMSIDGDELMDLCQRPDYEEAVCDFIMHEADLSELADIANNHGYWGDVLMNAHIPTVHEDSDEPGIFSFEGTTEMFDDEEDAEVGAIEHVELAIRQCVWKLVNTDEEYRAVCDEYNLDPENIEVYEHWVVTDWLARKLAEKGELTGEIAGLTIWGRCCTGQSISMDNVIQVIACELWPDELVEEKA